MQFNEVLELADTLPIDEQEELVEIIHHRVIEQRREKLLRDIAESEKEIAEGKCIPVTPEELMKELLE